MITLGLIRYTMALEKDVTTKSLANRLVIPMYKLMIL